MSTGSLVRLEAQRALFEREGSEHFFVRLRVTNPGASPVGIDLRDYWLVPRPNQWGGLEMARRGEINEERSIVTPLDEGRRTKLLEAFAGGALTKIPGGESLDVYVEFNASGRADVDPVESPYLFVSLDGPLIATDGRVCENLTLEWDGGEDRASSVILKAPFRWGTVPRDALVLLSP